MHQLMLAGITSFLGEGEPILSMSKREQLYNLIKQTFFLLDDGDRRLLETYKLSPTRFYAMYHISENPGLSSSELSDCLLCDKSNVTRIVKGLEKQGLLVRRPHETDGRALRLFLTHRGATVCAQVRSAHHDYNNNRLDIIDIDMRDALIDNLTTLMQTLEENLRTMPQNGSPAERGAGK